MATLKLKNPQPLNLKPIDELPSYFQRTERDIAVLARLFPAVFVRRETSGWRKLLKVGIKEDILATGLWKGGPSRLNRALLSYVKNDLYLGAYDLPGAMRHDLNGNPVEPPQPHHLEMIRNYKEIRRKRRARRMGRVELKKR